jgi:hypothetical protein
MEQYGCRTSGVLIESMFLHTIPIAPRKLLEANGIQGIGYDNIEELKDVNIFNYNCQVDYNNVLAEYDRNVIRQKLLDFLNSKI